MKKKILKLTILTTCLLLAFMVMQPILSFSQTIGGGVNHSLRICNGTGQAWGDNSYGQLGDGTTSDRSTPVQVSGLSNLVAIDGGEYHSIGLKSDGTLWGWGSNSSGELGDNSTTTRLTPVQFYGLSGVIAASAGQHHTMALKNDGTVWTCGYNLYGTLGNGTTTRSLVPIQVSGLTGIVAIAAGAWHSVALKNDGTVWAWGYDYYNYYGSTPVQVSGLSGITSVACGGYHSLALKNDGTLWGWGTNYYGALGNGTNTHSSSPVQVSGLTGITKIAGGGFHSIAIKSNGTVWTWGYNPYGQIGDGSTTNRLTPVQVTGLTTMVDIACGWRHSLANKNNNTSWSWGYNDDYELGDGTSTDRLTPVQVNGSCCLAPVAICQNLTVQLDNNGIASISASQVDNGSSSDCGIQSIVVNPATFNCSNIGANSVTLLVTDVNNNTSTCVATITVECTPPIVALSGNYSTLYSYGGNVYDATGTQVTSVTLNGTVSGQCSAYDLSWSGGATGNTASVTFAVPGIGITDYTFTASNNGACPASKTWRICVQDVRCGNSLQKVIICHSGNPICLSPSALPGHLAHGDLLGDCSANCGGLQKRNLSIDEEEINEFAGISLDIYPSPNNGKFEIGIKTSETGDLKISVIDLMGRIVFSETRKLSGSENIPVNLELATAGQYFVKAEMKGQVMVKRVMISK